MIQKIPSINKENRVAPTRLCQEAQLLGCAQRALDHKNRSRWSNFQDDRLEYAKLYTISPFQEVL